MKKLTLLFLLLTPLFYQGCSGVPLENCYTFNLNVEPTSEETVLDVVTIKGIEQATLYTICYKIELKDIWQNLINFRINEIVKITINKKGQIKVSRLYDDGDSQSTEAPVEEIVPIK